MRDSLSLRKLSSRGDRPTRQKTAEMKDRGRRSARGGSPSAPRKNSAEPVIHHSSSRKRTRGSTLSHQKGAPTPRIFQDRSFQVSPSPARRKRGRLFKEERMMASSTKTREKKRERKGRTRGRSSSTAQHGWVQQVTPSSGDVTLAPIRPSSSRMRESRPSSRRAAAGSAPDSSSLVRPAPSAISGTTAAFAPPAWPFLEQKPQRQTRQRPVDPDKLMKVCVERSDGGGDNTSSSNSSRGRNNSTQHDQAVQNPNLDHGEEYLASSASNACSSKASRGGGTSSRPHSNCIANGAVTSSSRRHVVRFSSGVASRSGGTSKRRAPPSSASNTTTTTPVSAQVSAATATREGGVRVEGRETEAAKTDNVVCPQFRLHNLFGAGNTTTTANTDDNQSGQSSGKPTFGPRRKRPVKTGAGATREGRSMAPPRRSASACGGGGGQHVGFLDQTKDALVRSTQAVFGSDYDMDDDDFAFLEQLNGGRSAGGGLKVATGGDFTGEKGWAVSANLFEGMIERLERQESRARD
ncbi:unnamed protein product, partial [Ectocarpus sp. 12 AP-2014]